MGFLKLIGTAVLSAGALFLIAKCMGHKQVAQLDFFDSLTGITIGSIAAELATELESPWKPLTALLIYGGLALRLDVLTKRSARSCKYVNGTPTILMDQGKLYRENLKKARLSLSNFLPLCRQSGYFNFSDIHTAGFEPNGRLAVLPRSDKRPATPEDLSLSPPQEALLAEVILDGRVLDENLRRMGLDVNWLEKQLRAQGYQSAQEVFLGLCDRNRALALYRAADASEG